MWFWIGFHFISFFKEIIKNVFLYGILSALLKNFGDMIHEKFKKTENAQKTSLSSVATWIAFLARKNLKFGFLYFYKSCRELNFLSKNINPESIGILSSKLWPKYETGAEDNTNSALSSIFSQNFKWVQRQICSSLSNRLILSLCFRRNIFEK